MEETPWSPEFRAHAQSVKSDYYPMLNNASVLVGKTKGHIGKFFYSGKAKEQKQLIDSVYEMIHGVDIDANAEDKNVAYNYILDFLQTRVGVAVKRNIQKIFDLQQEMMNRRGEHVLVNDPTAVVFIYEILTGDGSTMNTYLNKEDAIDELKTGAKAASITPIANKEPLGYTYPKSQPAALVPGTFPTREAEDLQGEIDRLHSEMQNDESDDEDTMDVEKGGKRKSKKYRKVGKKSKKGYKKSRKSRKSRKGRKKRHSRHHKK